MGAIKNGGKLSSLTDSKDHCLYAKVKRIFDLVLSVLLLLVLLPLIIVLILLQLLFIGRPVFFIQERPGKDVILFKLIKFRTMKVGAYADAERVTRWGKFLSSTSLDEIPQLINVIRGQMSLVGPRPILMEYLELYTPEQFKRHKVLPGITGWAQINGRNTVSWENRFLLDLWYVENGSLLLDLKILFLTLFKVLKQDAIHRGGSIVKVPCSKNKSPNG